MAEKLKIIPLGGLNEIGKNMTAYEYGGEIIVVDCGMAFPGDDMYGIDCVIPDVSYLVKNKSRLRGLFITHGHEDHIGAIPYVLKQINMPIYCTRFTAGLIKLKLQEHRLLDSTKLVTVEAGQTVKAGKFQVEFIHVNHSIADSVAFAIDSPAGTGRTIPSGTAIFSAYPPPPSSAHTSSPAFQRLPAGAARTVPATSSPIHSGQPGGGGYLPARWSKSARFSAAARIFSRTSPAFGTGSGTSVQCMACASSTFIAYMT